MHREQPKTALRRKAVPQSAVFRPPEQRTMACRSDVTEPKRQSSRVAQSRTGAGQKLPNRSAGQARGEVEDKIQFHRGSGRGTVAGLRHRRPRGNERDTGAETRHISSQTQSPLKIFLARATR